MELGAAFAGFTGLTSVTLPDSLVEVSGAFAGCAALTELDLGKGVSVIGAAVIDYTKVSALVISENMSVIKMNAFSSCDALTETTILNPLCTIGDHPFLTDIPEHTVIKGYDGSPAQQYADKHGNPFISLGPAPELLKGDLNGDGVFNVSDVVLLQKWLLAVSNTHLKYWKSGDLCEDDRLDVFDLCLMKRKLING